MYNNFLVSTFKILREFKIGNYFFLLLLSRTQKNKYCVPVIIIGYITLHFKHNFFEYFPDNFGQLLIFFLTILPGFCLNKAQVKNVDK